MSDDFINVIHREIERYMNQKAPKRIGLVSSYDPQHHSVKVQYQPEGQESGWIPIHSQHIGNGWGLVAGPQIGDQVEVTFQEGDFESGSVTSRIHSDVDQPPLVNSGEMLLQHQSGALIKFAADGSITATVPSAAHTVNGPSLSQVEINAAGRVHVKPASGQFVYLGGNPDEGGTYSPVVTVAGPSSIVFGKL